MRRLLHFIAPLKPALLGLGPIGLFFLSVIDASSIPTLPEVLMVSLALRHPHKVFLYAALTTLGSTLGSLIIFGLARHFGGPWVEKRMSPARFRRIHRRLEEYDVFAVAVPAMLPPPTPFKLFILAAGLFEISWLDFAVSVAVGRGVRYFAVAWLSVRYGAQAWTYLTHHLWGVAAVAAALIAFGYVMGHIRRRRGNQ